MYFNSNLRKLREENDLTQKDLASLLKVTRPTIAGYESKNHQPDFDKLLIISDFFHISVDDLLRKDLNAPQAFSYDVTSRDKDFHHFQLCYDTLSEESIKKLFDYIELLCTHEEFHKQKKE